MKFKTFRIHGPIVEQKVQFLLDRGGLLVKETREFIEIERGDQIANIDTMGRVVWRRKERIKTSKKT